jgi:hypothetical protein
VIQALAVLGLVFAPAAASSAQPVSPHDFPCSSFHRELDGSWRQVEPITVSNVTLTKISYEGSSKEAQSLDKRCTSQ